MVNVLPPRAEQMQESQATQSKSRKRDTDPVPFPPLPFNWRHSISKSNRYYFWQKGSKDSTYKHPTTGKEYRAGSKPAATAAVPSPPSQSQDAAPPSTRSSTPALQAQPPRSRDNSRARTRADDFPISSETPRRAVTARGGSVEPPRGRSRSIASERGVVYTAPSRASSSGAYARAYSDLPFTPVVPRANSLSGSAGSVQSSSSTREQVEQLNKDYSAQRISQEEYVHRWRSMFDSIREHKKGATPPAAPPLNVVQQRGQPVFGRPGRPPSRGPEVRAVRSPWPPQPPTAAMSRHGSLSLAPAAAAPPPAAGSPGSASRRSSSVPPTWGEPRSSRYHDPAPHLNQGSRLPVPGPRINPTPPPPPQYAPHFGMPMLPAPARPQPMNTLAPPLRTGAHISPPDGELVTKHTFNFATKLWSRAEIRVRIDKYPFQEGTLRSVFFMKDLSQPTGPAQDFVAKISKDPREPVDSYFQDCEMQALAGYLAEEFNKLNLPKKVKYLEASVIECRDRMAPVPGGRVVFAVEPYIQGTFCKYTNNYGWINPANPRNSPQAFSHFTHYYSQGTLVVVDIQGITDDANNDHYTDPQIHTRPGLPAFGKADLRGEGIQKFFETHECNSICQALGLPRITKDFKVIHDNSAQQRTLPPPNPNLIWELRHPRPVDPVAD